MLELKIRFESSWTNSFYEEPGGAPLFTSGSDLSGSAKQKLNPVAFDREAALRSGSRLAFLQALQAANPGLLYRVPVSFDRALQGVLARLVGEVRRLSDVEPSHLALRAFTAGQCHVDIEHEYSQTTKLATYEINKIQTQGAGLINNELLYADSEVALNLFGHLGQSLQDIEFAIDDILKTGPRPAVYTWFPPSPAALIDRINALDEEQAALIKVAKKAAGKGVYTSPFAALFKALAATLADEAPVTLAKQQELHKQGKPAGLSIEAGALDGWSIAGATIVARIKLYTDTQKTALISAGALTRSGGLAGIAMSGAIGNVTPKDLFSFASGVNAVSNRMPYTVDVPVPDATGRSQPVPTGVLKKTGTITYTLNDSPALEQELHNAIEAASVGPFHFGKKGIAYVQSLEIY